MPEQDLFKRVKSVAIRACRARIDASLVHANIWLPAP